MKKKLLSVLLAATMLATVLVGCGGGEEPATPDDTVVDEPTEPADPADPEPDPEPAVVEDTGKVLNIYCFNDEFQRRMTAHYPGYTHNEDGTGTIGDITVNWRITPNEGNAYQDDLDENLLIQADKADDEKIDIFLIEADYALKYIDSEFAMNVNDLGLTAEDMQNQYQYTKDVVTDDSGVVKGTSWQACPGLFLYRRSAAKEIFGSDDPDVVQQEVADWDKFNEAAAKVHDAGYKMLGSYPESFRTFSNNVSQPWVIDNKIIVDDNLMKWVDQTKMFTENGYNVQDEVWGGVKAASAAADGDGFGYFGPAWYIDFVFAGYTLADPEAPAEVGNGSWGDWAATEGPQGFFWGGTWICAAVGTDNQATVRDIMYQLTCNPDVMVGIVEQDNDFVNHQPKMDELAAAGTMTSAFLGGQNVLAKYAEGVKTIDMSNISIYDQGLNEGFQRAMQDYFDGNVTKEEALTNFYEAAVVLYPELTYDE